MKINELITETAQVDVNNLSTSILGYAALSDAGKAVQSYMADVEAIPTDKDDLIQLIDEVFYNMIENGDAGPLLPDEKSDLRFFYKAVKTFTVK